MSGERLGDIGTVWFCAAALRSSSSKLRETGEVERVKGEVERCLLGAAIRDICHLKQLCLSNYAG